MKHTDYKVNSDQEEFIRYMIDFYGFNGIYPHWHSTYIEKQTSRYIEIYPDASDSLDRERCRDYLFYTSRIYQLKELEHFRHTEKTILKRRQKDRKIKINNILTKKH